MFFCLFFSKKQAEESKHLNMRNSISVNNKKNFDFFNQGGNRNEKEEKKEINKF